MKSFRSRASGMESGSITEGLMSAESLYILAFPCEEDRTGEKILTSTLLCLRLVRRAYFY